MLGGVAGGAETGLGNWEPPCFRNVEPTVDGVPDIGKRFLARSPVR